MYDALHSGVPAAAAAAAGHAQSVVALTVWHWQWQLISCSPIDRASRALCRTVSHSISFDLLYNKLRDKSTTNRKPAASPRQVVEQVWPPAEHRPFSLSSSTEFAIFFVGLYDFCLAVICRTANAQRKSAASCMQQSASRTTCCTTNPRLIEAVESDTYRRSVYPVQVTVLWTARGVCLSVCVCVCNVCHVSSEQMEAAHCLVPLRAVADLGCVHIDTSPSTSPAFRLRVVCHSYKLHPHSRVERSRSLVQAHNSKRVYWQSPVKSNRANALRKSINIVLYR